MKNRLYFNYEKQMTNEDIVEHAKIIAQASKEVKEIEEARKKLKDLHNTIARHSRYIQQGKIEFVCYGEFEWHRPVHNVVTVSSPYGDFRTYVRDMTPAEIEEHCELEIPFEQEDTIVVTSEEEAEKAKNRLKAVGWNVTDEELNEMVLIKDRVETVEDDRELSEIFDTDLKPEDEDKWYIHPRPDSQLYLWGISKDTPRGRYTMELFRTKEEAEEFMAMFVVGNNAYHSIPGSIFQLNRNSKQWEIVRCGYKGDEIATVVVLHEYTCYYEAKDALQRLYDATIKEGKSIFPPKSETPALGGTDKYQIVEGPDGHLTTIPKEEAA